MSRSSPLRFDYLLVGGGLAGSLLALALFQQLPKARVVVEMCSHVGILIGHALMMIGWWSWFFQGYPGVEETLLRLGNAS